MKKKFGWNFFFQILFAQGFIPRGTFLYNMNFRINFLHKKAVCNFSFNYKQLFYNLSFCVFYVSFHLQSLYLYYFCSLLFLLRYFSIYILLFHTKLFWLFVFSSPIQNNMYLFFWINFFNHNWFNTNSVCPPHISKNLVS